MRVQRKPYRSWLEERMRKEGKKSVYGGKSEEGREEESEEQDWNVGLQGNMRD